MRLPLNIPQAGALPFRRIGPGRIQLLLVTTSAGKSWILPKGMILPSLRSSKAAAREAFEEAGVEGKISAQPIGAYSYRKRSLTCRVQVHVLEVTREHADWPERGKRERRWVSPEEALRLIDRQDLRDLVAAAVRSLV